MPFGFVLATLLSLVCKTDAHTFWFGRCGETNGSSEAYVVSPRQQTLDFRDLQPINVKKGNGDETMMQIHCHEKYNYQLIFWDDPKDAEKFRNGWSTGSLGNHKRYPVKDIDSFVKGECVSSVDSNYSQDQVQYSSDAETKLYLPDCKIYDPAEFCPNCYPMMKFLGLGFDITTDTIVAPGQMNSKQHIARLFGDEENIPDTSYVHSSNTFAERGDRTIQEGSIKNFVNTLEMRESRSTSLGLKKNFYKVLNIAATCELTESETNTFKRKMARSELVMEKSLYTTYFKSTNADKHTTYQFWVALSRFESHWVTHGCRTDCYDEWLYYIIRPFGTHYVNKVTIGGQVKFILETDACMKAKERSQSVEAGLCASVKKEEGCSNAGVEGDTNIASSNSVQSYALEIIGGPNEVSKICYMEKDNSAVSCDFTAFADLITDEEAGLIKFELASSASLFLSMTQVAGRLASSNGGWDSLNPEVAGSVDALVFFKKYIEDANEKRVDALPSPCDSREFSGSVSTTKIGAKLSLIGLLVSGVVVSML